MPPPRLLILLLTLFLLAGCQLFQPTAYFFISNTSRDSKPVDIKVTLDGKTVFNDSIEYTGIQPDLKYTPYISFPKGKYTIRVSADSGRTIAEQPINLGNDRWIFVTYSYEKPIDSAQAKMLLANFANDTSWVNPKLRGSAPEVAIYVMDKEPVHR